MILFWFNRNYFSLFFQVNFIKQRGGKSPKDVAVQVWKLQFTNKLGSNINYCGLERNDRVKKVGLGRKRTCKILLGNTSSLHFVYNSDSFINFFLIIFLQQPSLKWDGTIVKLHFTMILKVFFFKNYPNKYRAEQR